MKKTIVLLCLVSCFVIFSENVSAQTTFTFSFKSQDPSYIPSSDIYVVAVKIIGDGWQTSWVSGPNFTPAIPNYTLYPNTTYNEEVTITIPNPSPPIPAEYCQMELVIYKNGPDNRILGYSQWMTWGYSLDAGFIDPGSF